MTEKETVVRVTYKNGAIADVFASGDIKKLVMVLKKDGDILKVEAIKCEVEYEN